MKTNVILLVDDEEDLVVFVKIRLERAGYKVLVAYDGLQALEKVQEVPDLILLDIMMPEMDGFEALRQLKNKHETRYIPVIMLTAKGAAGDIFKSQELGATDYIIKPFEIPQLLELIKKYLPVDKDRGVAKD